MTFLVLIKVAWGIWCWFWGSVVLGIFIGAFMAFVGELIERNKQWTQE